MTQGDPGPMATAVAAALATITAARPEDAGAIELCRRYADLLDAATPRSTYVRHLRAIRNALATGEPDDAYEALEKIEDALGAHSVASDLGPKLLAALTALGLTLAGRRTAPAEGGGPGVGAGASEFEQRRARARERRERGAG